VPPDKLPEEFAPTGPKLSRFPIRPAPPVKPHLFPDEARFVLRVSAMAGATEFTFWAWLTMASGNIGAAAVVLGVAALRIFLRPAWALAGTRLPRPLIATALLLVQLVLVLFFFAVVANDELDPGPWAALAFVAMGLPALGDLCASVIGDRVTVERRPTAYGWLDIAQGLGGALGLAFYYWHGWYGWPVSGGTAIAGKMLILAFPLALLLPGVGVPDLRNRGTPRSTWPLSAYASALRTPLAAQLSLLALACAGLAMNALAGVPVPTPGALEPIAVSRWVPLALPLAGMVLASRVEPFLPNAIVLPRGAAVLALAGWAFSFWPVGALAMGAMFAAIPAAVARGAGEMERPLVSSLAWSALILGAAIGAVLRY